MSQLSDAYAFCQQELKKHDPIKHFIALTAAESDRAALMAFFALQSDISRIPNRVSEPTMGEVRIQWWIDAISNQSQTTHEAPTSTEYGPLYVALQNVLDRYKLSAHTLIQMIRARAFDLYDDPMDSYPIYKNYVSDIQTGPVMQAAQILNHGDYPEEHEELAQHVGMAVALARHLFSWPALEAKNQQPLPSEVPTNDGLVPTLLRPDLSKNELNLAINALTDLARFHHSEAVKRYALLTQSNHGHLSPAFLELALVPRLLAMRQKAPIAHLTLPNWRAYWSIWRMAA